MIHVCTYCGKKVPDGIEPSQFECCGEIGHTEEVDEDDLG